MKTALLYEYMFQTKERRNQDSCYLSCSGIKLQISLYADPIPAYLTTYFI